MRLLHRFEFWLLLALATVAGLFVLFTQERGEEEGLVSVTAPASSEAPPAVRRLTLLRDHGNVRLEIEVSLTNASSRSLQLVSPTVRLRTGRGREVPLFFLPSQPPPALSPRTTSQVKLRFWLEAGDLAESLTLEFNKERLSVKSDRAFSLEQLKNDEPLTLPPSGW